MKEIKLKAYGKINLSLDVVGKRPDGYHEIESVMQDIDIFDDVAIKAHHKDIHGYRVMLDITDENLPKGPTNTAVKGALAVLEGYVGEYNCFDISIAKNIPVAAGLAGGSSNGAVTMLGINKIIGYRYSLKELMIIGAKIGADFPFSITMNAFKNGEFFKGMKGIEESGVTALAKGIGDDLKVIDSFPAYVILANPGISVSTKEVYENIDNCEMLDRPDTKELLESIESKKIDTAYLLMKNVMEEYTLNEHPKVLSLKKTISEKFNADKVLMSGSGPTIVAYFSDEAKARKAYNENELDCKLWLSNTGVHKK
jgi:4-diphosphocytidyl-2-C-methyl-D-erythritol kinase